MVLLITVNIDCLFQKTYLKNAHNYKTLFFINKIKLIDKFANVILKKSKKTIEKYII